MNGNYAPLPGKIPGAAINLGGHDLILAPLNLNGVQTAESLLDKLKTATPQETLTIGAQIVALSLNRNYPDMTVDDVLGLMDLGNVHDAIVKTCGGSGMVFGKPGESPPIP